MSDVEDSIEIFLQAMRKTNNEEMSLVFDGLTDLQKRVLEKIDSLRKRKERLQAKVHERQDISDRVKRLRDELKDLMSEARSQQLIIQTRRKVCS